jgi:hypothetical protein
VREIENVGCAAIFPLDRVVVRSQEMARHITGRLGIDETDVVEAGCGACEG